MAVLSIRNFPDVLLADLNAQSERAGMTLRGYVIKRLKGERGIAAGAPVFQTGDAGSTPAVRSNSPDEPDEELDYSDIPFQDLPSAEQKRRKFAELHARFGKK